MLRRTIARTAFAAVLGLSASTAFADGEKVPLKVSKDAAHGADHLDRIAPPRRPAYRAPHRTALYHHRRHHQYRPAYRGWDGRYGPHARRHFVVAGMPAYELPGAVSVTTVTYRSTVYYTPAYASVSYGYPPYARVYDLTAGPVYNKPCFC